MSEVIQGALQLFNIPNYTTTENGALAYETTESAVLDLFFQMIRHTSMATLEPLVRKAWIESPANTLKVIMHCRDCRKGKGEKLLALQAMFLIRKYKPKTYLKHLLSFLDMGYYKDLLNLAIMAKQQGEPFFGKSNYIELELFAEVLKQDNAHLSTNEPISLAAKWAPTEGHMYDKKCHFAEQLAALLFPSVSFSQRMKQYRLLLSALRKKIKVVEHLMASNQWDQIEYKSVPSKSHLLHKSAFLKHDAERYNAYVDSLQNATSTIKSTGLQPHELTEQIENYLPHMPEFHIIEAQWRTLLDMFRAKDSTCTNYNVLPLCDVSGSMEGEPMEVCVALGLLLSQLATGPFAQHVLTFESVPSLIHISTDKHLHEQVMALKRAPWGGSTNLSAAFDAILAHATKHECRQDDLPKMLVIFSDMQFDMACNDSKQSTLFECAKQKFAERGYELPKVVFWNLRSTISSFPVTIHDTGVALLSGYSAQLFKMLMNCNGELSPNKMLMELLQPYDAFVRPMDLDELTPFQLHE